MYRSPNPNPPVCFKWAESIFRPPIKRLNLPKIISTHTRNTIKSAFVNYCIAKTHKLYIMAEHYYRTMDYTVNLCKNYRHHNKLIWWVESFSETINGACARVCVCVGVIQTKCYIILCQYICFAHVILCILQQPTEKTRESFTEIGHSVNLFIISC